jgi:hypothetical protein
VTALTFRAVSTAGDSNNTNLVVAKPAGTAVGDHMWALLYLETPVGASVTGSWTAVHDIIQAGPAPDIQAVLWCRIATAADVSGTDYTFSWGGAAVWRTGAIIGYSDGDATTIQDVAASENTGGIDANAIALGITPVTNDAEVIVFEADFDTRSATPPTGTTPTFAEQTDFGGLSIHSGPLTAAAATGDKTVVLSATSYWMTFLAASRPAVPGGGPPQFARPASDVSDGTWTDDGGGTSLFAAIDETSFNDADFIQSAENPTADLCKIRLSSVGDPAVGTGHIVRYRYKKSATAGQQIDIVVRLYRADGTTVVASQSHNNIDAVTDGSFTLSGGEADSIPTGDYATGLVLGVEATAP